MFTKLHGPDGFGPRTSPPNQPGFEPGRKRFKEALK
jgi:hypothetical protein